MSFAQTQRFPVLKPWDDRFIAQLAWAINLFKLQQFFPALPNLLSLCLKYMNLSKGGKPMKIMCGRSEGREGVVLCKMDNKLEGRASVGGGRYIWSWRLYIINLLLGVNSMFYFFIPMVNGLGVAQYPFLLQYEPIPEKIETYENLQTSFSPIILPTLPSSGQPHSEMTLENKQEPKCQVMPKNQDYDQQYVPVISLQRKEKKKSSQLENRNVIPNMIRLILSFVQKKGKSLALVDKLLKLHNPDPDHFNTHRFYLFQKAIKDKMNNYVNLETLREYCKIRKQEFSVFTFEEQKCYNKITKILINYFLKEEVQLFILTSKRMEKEKKKYHIEVIRNLQMSLKALLSNQ